MTGKDRSGSSGRKPGAWRMFGGIAACLAVALPANAQELSTTREWEAMSATAANRAIRRDLLSILAPRGKVKAGMFRSLRGVGMSTRPVGTSYKQVCRRDSVTLWYMPDDRSGEAEDWPVRPYSISAEPFFHLLALPKIDDATGQPEESSPDRRACLALDDGRDDPRNAGDDDEERGRAVWISAKNALQAVRAALVMDMALKDVKAGTLRPLPCGDNKIGPLMHSCEEAIMASGGWREMDSVEECPAETGSICYKVSGANGMELTIVAREDGERAAPSQILSIAVEQLIIVT
jgi:hypothetical protein